MAIRKRTKKPVKSGIGYDGKPPKLVEVRGIDKAEREAKVTCKRNVNENPMDRLFHLDLINGQQRLAGLKLIRDWELSQIGPMRGVSLDGRAGAPKVNLVDAQCDAISRLRQALDRAGHSGRIILVAVVLEGETFKQAAMRLHCHHKGVLPALKVALDALIQFYGVFKINDAA